jgi:hypothetical protein
MKKQKTTKLALNTETLKNLDLATVVGGSVFTLRNCPVLTDKCLPTDLCLA